MNRKIRVLTWNIHGNYLYYLSFGNYELIVPVKDNGEEGYSKLAQGFVWNKNVQQIPAEDIKKLEFDLILFQTKKNYLEDQFEILSHSQRFLPQIYLEHEPPRENPTNNLHVVNDNKVPVVHVTNFNKLMWDNRDVQTKVIEHGVLVPNGISYKGDIAKGVVVINNLKNRGRRLGLDIFLKTKKNIPLDLIGINSEQLGGLGNFAYGKLLKIIPHYRFFFNPIRYTSLGLAVCEAMMIGMPVVGFATTEMATVIKNNERGFTDTNTENLIKQMKMLLDSKITAQKIGEKAKKYAQKRFNIKRFTKEWERTFENVIKNQNKGKGINLLVDEKFWNIL